ncbi:MAG: hypothetical protein M1840_004338 [Geoglossum simile]|nr:MAG: hypothetical protein M1840_004338 [Geoglossum simile]
MEPSISDAHTKCFLSFVELLSAIENPVRDFRGQVPLEDVVEEFGKYKLWAGNVGAAHSGKRYEISLDYRLKEASFYKTQTGTDLRLAHKVLKLLGTLDNMVRILTPSDVIPYWKWERATARRWPLYALGQSGSTPVDVLNRLPKAGRGPTVRGRHLGHYILHYIAKLPPNFLALSLIQGERKPFEELSLSDYQADPTTSSEDDPDDQVGADDSPWEISSDSGDEEQLDPKGSTQLTRKCGAPSAQAATTGTQDSDSTMLLVQRPTMEMPQLLESLKFTIACLYKLPIRRPAPLDRLKQKSSIDASFYQPFDVLYIQDKLPQLDLKVATRLGKMISRRRQLLFYLISHEKSLETAKVEPKKIQADPATIETSPEKSSGLGVVREVAVSVVSSQQPPLTKATTLRINTVPAEALDTLYAPSLAESASSAPSSYAGETLRVEVPPRPKGKEGKDLDFFKCPYCLTTKLIKNDRAWKKHVLGDLRPYVCTFPDCDLLEHFFDTREEWYKHEVQQHRVEWFCNIEGHQFTEISDFLEHMELAHDTTFNASHRSLLSMFRRPSRSLTGTCNLCLRPSSNLKSHISRHLEQIALFALPRANGAMSGETELKSDFSGRNVDGSVDRDEIQGKPKGSESSQTVSHSEKSEAEELQSGEPGICDPVDQVIVPDGADPSWDMITSKFSEARKGLAEVGSDFEPKQILESYQGPEDQIRRDIAAEISPLDFSTKQNDTLNSHRSGTGEWLFETDAFKGWLTGMGKTLLCHGIAGVGKTVLSSIVVDYLEHQFWNENVAVIYVYCSYNDQEGQTAVNLIASLLQQLIKKNSVISKGVLTAYERRRERRPTVAEYSDLLESEAGRFSKVFIIVDALDECSNGTRDTFVGEIKRLQSQLATIYLFATSRDFLDSDYNPGPALSVEIQPTGEEIKLYVVSRIGRERQLIRLIDEQPALQEIITKRSIEVAGGMFLRAQLFMDSISSLPTVQTLQQALASGPWTMDDFYRGAMQRVESQDEPAKDLAKGVLSWVSTVLYPLRIRELQHALIVNPEDTGISEDVVPDAELIVSVCAGLVTIHSNDMLGFTHPTIKEYFQRTHMIWFPDARARVAITCLSYISFDVFADGPCQSGQEMEIRRDDYPLLMYAAWHWGNHAYGDPEEVVKGLALKFLEHPAKFACSLQAAWLPRDPFLGYSQSFPTSITGLHIAAIKGLEKILVLLLQQENIDVNALDDHQRTPLSWAAEEGREAVVRLLLACDRIDVNASNEGHYAPLSYAAQNGHEAIVQLLLASSDIDLNPRSDDGRTPLSWAAGTGHNSVVQLLLGSDVSTTDNFSRSPLWWAVEIGHEKVVQQLLKCNGIDPNLEDLHGLSPLALAASYGNVVIVQQLLELEDIDINSRGVDDRTPLWWAANGGHEAVVRLLLARREILANFKDKIGRTPLSLAAEGGRDAVVQVLLACDGIEVDSKDNYGRSPLWWAARNGQEAVVLLLLGCTEIDVDSKDSVDRTPLSWAAEGGHIAVIQLLLSHGGIDVNSKDRIGQTPLSWAAGGGCEGAVLLLLAHEGIDVNPRDSFGRTPLWWAAWGEHEAVVQLLLICKDIDLNPKGKHGRTPLLWAAIQGYSEIVDLLLGCEGIDVNSKDESDRTPLLWAARNGHEAVVCLLLEFQGTDVNSRDKDGRTPLLWAAESGRELVARLLLDRRDIDADSKDEFGEAPLLWAAESGQEAIVELLLEFEGIDVNSSDGCGRTALWWAAWGGHGAVVRLLLTNGGIDVNAKDTYGRAALWWAARNGHEAAVRLLLECKDIDADPKDDSGRTALSWAARNGHEAVVRLLLEFKDIDVNPRDDTGRTPLSWLAGSGHKTAVQLLLKCKDIDINTRDNDNQTPLGWTARNGHEAVVRFLLEFKGIDVNPRDDTGRTPLSWLAGSGNKTAVQLLLKCKDIDINTRDNDNQTPLGWAARNGQVAVVQLLLERKDVDVNPRDNPGRTPLMWAANNGHKVVVERLLAHGDVDVNSDHCYGQTPLWRAAANGEEEVVRLLLKCKGINVNARDSRGQTPLSRAAENGHDQVVRLLLERKDTITDLGDDYGRTPLSLAQIQGHEEVVRLLSGNALAG